MQNNNNIFNKNDSIHHSTLYLIIGLLVLFIPFYAFSATKTVLSTGSALITEKVTYEQAVMFAINQARVDAIEKAGVISVNNSTLILNNSTVADYIKSFSSGFIVSEEIVNWTQSWSPSIKRDRPPYPQLNVSIRSSVNIPDKHFIRHHIIDAKLNRSNFRNGENAIFTVMPHSNLYLLIVNYTSKGTIMPIFPNRYARNNYLKKNIGFTYPPANNSKVSIEINTYNYNDNDTEAFLLFALPIDPQTRHINWLALFPPAKEISYADFHSKLLDLPLEWLAEKILVYTVRKE